jgi:hypothetical protein
MGEEQVARWREDDLWLVRFLKRLEGKLLLMLAGAVAMHDPRVLSRWYRLDGRGASTVVDIANELGMTQVEVQLAHDLMLRYLRRDEGRAALQEVVLLAAKETERISSQGS